ncbi:MAG: hypothetical protein HYX45_07490 [Burkholderiales bacterium]|nr:hypothetical protein [Burkholderiales bacterium]
MILEEVLERAAQEYPGYEIATFREAGLPVYALTLKVLVLERKELSPIEEGILRAVHAGLESTDDIVLFLGLPSSVLTPVLAALNSAELVNYMRSVGDASPRVALTAKGKTALMELVTVAPEERTIPVCLDALTRKLLFISPEQLYRPRDMREFGMLEVSPGSSKRPEKEDIPVEEFDKVLQRRRTSDSKPELLAIRRIERRELRFLDCLLVYYRNVSNSQDIRVGFWKDDGPSVEHENAFRALGGPEQIGAKLLAEAKPSLEEMAAPLIAGVTPQSADGATASPIPVDGPVVGAQPLAGETLQYVQCHEHPKLLKRALTSAKKRLVIISPWIRHQVVDWGFVASLEALLRQGVQVDIGYGIDDGVNDGRKDPTAKIAITKEAERDLRELERKYKNFRLTLVGNTHRKQLICDDEFAVTTSFNWLSFKGSPRGNPRDEFGVVVRKKPYVEKAFEEAKRLLSDGYSGR